MYIVDANADEPIMLLLNHIGYDEEDGQGVDSVQFQNELLYLDSLGKKRICIWINSPGGIVMDGYNIFNAILQTKTKVDTYVTGMAASIAAVIFQAGRNRIMCDYGILMYHNPFGGSDDSTEAVRNSIIKMIEKRSGMTDGEVAAMMNRETFIDADEALKLKLCDVIENSEELNRKRAVPASNNFKEYWRESGKILNKIFNTFDMKKIANRLKLNDAATEDNIVSEIDAIENRAKASEKDAEKCKKDMEDAKEKADKAKKDYDEMKEKYDEMKKEMDKMKNDMDEEDKKNKKEKAKNLIKEGVKAGKIKNEVKIIETWEAKAVADFAGTKDMIDSIPQSKQSVKIEKVAGAGDESLPSIENAIAQDMLSIRNKFQKV